MKHFIIAISILFVAGCSHAVVPTARVLNSVAHDQLVSDLQGAQEIAGDDEVGKECWGSLLAWAQQAQPSKKTTDSPGVAVSIQRLRNARLAANQELPLDVKKNCLVLVAEGITTGTQLLRVLSQVAF